MNKDNISWDISFDKQIENFIIAYEKALKLATDCYSINNELAYYLYKQLQACQEQVTTKTQEIEEYKECKNCFETCKLLSEQIRVFRKENTALKQQLDAAVEALKGIAEIHSTCGKCGGSSNCGNCCETGDTTTYEIAKTALDKVKEKSR